MSRLSIVREQLTSSVELSVPRLLDEYSRLKMENRDLKEACTNQAREIRNLEREGDLQETMIDERDERIERMERELENSPKQIGDDIDRLVEMTPSHLLKQEMKKYADTLRSNSVTGSSPEQAYLFDIGKPEQKELKFASQ